MTIEITFSSMATAWSDGLLFVDALRHNIEQYFSNSYSFAYLESVLLPVLLLLSLGITFLYLRQRTDVLNLKNALRALCRSSSMPARIAFRTKNGQELWNSILMLGTRTRLIERSREAYDEAISLSSRLAGAADHELQAGDALVEIIMKQTAPEVSGVAVVLRDEKSGELKVASVAGIPRKRTETALLMCFDTVLDGDTQDGRWGYHFPQDASCFDFSVFGMGLCLVVPLRNGESVCGGIWLGFKAQAESLPSRRKEFIQAVAEHAAASFYAARKAKERTERSDRERDFLLGMSHDLRAPGNRALYVVRELIGGQFGTLSEEQQEQIGVLEHAIDEQLGLLDDVLEYAKFQKGFLSAKPSRMSVRTILEQTLADYRIEAEKRGLRFFSKVIPDVLIEIDSRHLKRILANLLSNAVKYTERGRIEVVFEKDENHLVISVMDTGVGVPVDERGHLFEEFRRGANHRKKEGVGLGLALTKVLTELNGGEVFYRPNVKEGSVFGVRIPISLKSQCLDVKLGSILVVDDDPSVCRTISRYVRDMAEVVVPASSIEEAREIVNGLRPDLIISDFHLQEGDAGVLFRDVPKETRSIIVTGSAEAEHLLGADFPAGTRVMEKPADRHSLRSLINQLFADETNEFSNNEYKRG